MSLFSAETGKNIKNEIETLMGLIRDLNSCLHILPIVLLENLSKYDVNRDFLKSELQTTLSCYPIQFIQSTSY